jgi:NAD(P)-dependent dehydrogenase (short-subunit alcohol dehydrogenase family)
LFEDVRKFGIKVCTIEPDWVQTPMTEGENLDHNKMIRPEDVAQAVMFVLKSSEYCCPVEIVLKPQKDLKPLY